MEQAPATPLPSNESALHLPPDTISFSLARLQSIDRPLIPLICLCLLCLLFPNCSFSNFFCLLIFNLFASRLELLLLYFLFHGFHLAVPVQYLSLRSAVVLMVLIFNFRLPLTIIYILI